MYRFIYIYRSGYIVVGDDAMILDDLTIGYIRRMLNVKFPGDFYPPFNRQEKEKFFGRHCVNHCNTLDNCDDHLVNYAIDADLPSGYVNNEHERID